MNGAIFFSGRYGSTAQYARWISEATGLPVFRTSDAGADPAAYDFVVLGSSIVFYKATIRRWMTRNWSRLQGKPLILFTVSGAPPGPKLDGWLADSLTDEQLAGVEHVALRGRLQHEDVSWWLRLVLKVGGLRNKDPQAKQDEMQGFDYMDRASIEPIVARIREHREVGERPTTTPR